MAQGSIHHKAARVAIKRMGGSVTLLSVSLAPKFTSCVAMGKSSNSLSPFFPLRKEITVEPDSWRC